MSKPQLLTLLLVIHDDEILLAMKKRGFGTGMWNGAGGKVEPGETIEEAMVRETHEEIQIKPLEYERVAVHTFIFDTGKVAEVHTYTCKKWQGTPVETEEMAPKWFKLDQIPYNSMWPDDALWLPFVLDGKKLVTAFTFNEYNEVIKAHIEVVQALPDQ